MSKGMFSTSVGRKILMSLSGLFLITFIVVHLGVNLLSLSSNPDLFNEASHFMATNPVIFVMQFVLAFGFIFHIVMGIYLTKKNNAARPIKYAYNKPGESSSFSSRSMIITGMLVLLFLILHMKGFFYTIKCTDMGDKTDYDLLVETFGMWQYTVVYVVSFILLGIHLNHGFQSAFQSIGINHKKYTPWIKMAGVAYCILVTVGFSAIALFHFINA